MNDRNASPDLCVLVPAYNEQSRIKRTLQDIIDTLHAWPCASEILVIDDGSTDETAALCNRLFRERGVENRARVVSLEQNSGKGAAVRKGLELTNARWTLMMDADNSARLSEVTKLAPRTHQQGTHLVIGSRRMDTSEVKKCVKRHLVGLVYTSALRTLGLSLANDTQCGFKLYSKPLAKRIAQTGTEDGFAFDIEHLLVARALKIRVPEVGIMWNHVDGSKVNPIVDGLKMLGRIISMRGSVSKRAGNPDLAHEPPLVLLAAPSQVEVHTVTTSAEHAAAKAAEEAVAETTANESTEFSRSV